MNRWKFVFLFLFFSLPKKFPVPLQTFFFAGRVRRNISCQKTSPWQAFGWGGKKKKKKNIGKSLSLSLDGKQLVFIACERKKVRQEHKNQNRGEARKLNEVKTKFMGVFSSWIISCTQKPHTEWFNKIFFLSPFCEPWKRARGKKWWIRSHQDDTSFCCLIIWHLVPSNRERNTTKNEKKLISCSAKGGKNSQSPIYHSQYTEVSRSFSPQTQPTEMDKKSATEWEMATDGHFMLSMERVRQPAARETCECWGSEDVNGKATGVDWKCLEVF